MTTNNYKTTFAESVNLYENSYGSAKKISRTTLISSAVILCIVTPFTNWLIPALPKLIKKGITVRYN